MLESGFSSRFVEILTYHLGDVEVRRVGPELWFTDGSRIAWALVGNVLSAPEKTAEALQACGFNLSSRDLAFLNRH